MPIGKHGVKRILGELVSNVNNNATQSLSLLRSELGTDGMKNDHESDLPPTKYVSKASSFYGFSLFS
jgi:hypothetical protein